MNEQRVNEIVEFWKARTGRAGPKTISFGMLGHLAGYFSLGDIRLHLILADDGTVFHELVHLEQFQDGRLTYCVESSTYWFEGKPVNELPYLERPAEIEAQKRSKELRELFAGKS